MLLFMLQFQIACKEYIVEITDNCVYTYSNSTSIQHYLEFDFSAVSYNEGSVVVITMQHITSTSIPFLHKVTNEILLLNPLTVVSANRRFSYPTQQNIS